MTEFDYMAPFLAEDHDRDGLLHSMDSLLTREELFVRAIPFGCPDGDVAWFANAGDDRRSVSEVRRNGNVSLFRLSYRYRDGGTDRTGEKPFFVVRHPDFHDTFVAFSLDTSSFFHNRVLQPFIRSLYPRCLLTFITHKRLRLLVEQFDAANNFERLTVTRATARIRYGHGTQSGSVPLVHWPGRPLAEAFDWVHDNNGWFQSIEFCARGRVGTSVSVGLTRQGLVKTNRLLLKCYEGFILPVCKHIHENQQFFSGRGRKEIPHLGIRPIAIDFGLQLFDDVDENKKFINAIREYSSAAVSVLHGNPYLHLSVIDYFDGSNFDVWAADGNQLVIVPQLKASMPAVKRLVNHIFDTYAEGRMVNYEVVQ